MTKSDILKEVHSKLDKMLDNRKKELSKEIMFFKEDIHDNAEEEMIVLQERLDELMVVKSLVSNVLLREINSSLKEESNEMP